MKRIVVFIVAALSFAAHAQAQDKSSSSGFFLGVGVEPTAVATSVSNAASVNESGIGGGLVLGYGFSPQWALYGTISAASIPSALDLGDYSLTHLDVGARVHFRTGPNVVVPFLQFGVSGRATEIKIPGVLGTTTATAKGNAVVAGGGFNAYVNPKIAFSGSVTFSFGNFSDYTFNGATIAGPTESATTTRIHIGVIFFPSGHR